MTDCKPQSGPSLFVRHPGWVIRHHLPNLDSTDPMTCKFRLIAIIEVDGFRLVDGRTRLLPHGRIGPGDAAYVKDVPGKPADG